MRGHLWRSNIIRLHHLRINKVEDLLQSNPFLPQAYRQNIDIDVMLYRFSVIAY